MNINLISIIDEEPSPKPALIENPDFEICILRENIIQRLRHSRSKDKNQYADSETLQILERLANKTKNEKPNQSKRDLFAKWSIEDGYNSARMVDQIELEEEKIVEEVNKETVAFEKHQMDDIYYLDSNNSMANDEANQTNSTVEDEQVSKLNKQSFTNEPQIKEQKFHLDQQPETTNFNHFNHFSEDDENDNEDGDSDLDQVISTTTITSLNYAVNNKQTNHLDKKQ